MARESILLTCRSSPVPISAVIIFVTLFLAFSDFCRALLWWLWSEISTFILVQTPLYRSWLNLRDRWSSQALLRAAAENVTEMKDEVRRVRAREKAEKLQNSPAAELPNKSGSPDNDAAKGRLPSGDPSTAPQESDNPVRSREWNRFRIREVFKRKPRNKQPSDSEA